MKPHLQYSEEEIKNKLSDLWITLRARKAKDPEWTRETFVVLDKIGEQLGYKSLYSSKCGGPTEWLWDFVWIERDSESDNIVSVPLVAESEWNTSDLKIDFEKLVVSCAPLRLFIFQTQTEERAVQEISKLKGLSASYCICPAKYLTACWIWGGSNPRPVFDSWSIDPH